MDDCGKGPSYACSPNSPIQKKLKKKIKYDVILENASFLCLEKMTKYVNSFFTKKRLVF